MADGPQIAVGAIVIRDEELLMVRRGHEPGAGLWSVPGGRVEKGEYLTDALEREVLEETGLQIDVAELAGLFEVVGEEHFVVLDYLATVSGTDDAPRAMGDADDARWVPLDEIKDLDCTPRFEELLNAWGVLADGA